MHSNNVLNDDRKIQLFLAADERAIVPPKNCMSADEQDIPDSHR